MEIFGTWGNFIFVEKCSNIPHFCSSVSTFGVQMHRNMQRNSRYDYRQIHQRIRLEKGDEEQLLAFLNAVLKRPKKQCIFRRI
jgi:hypothetical protein